jgi:hypothetical protein
MLKVYYSLSWGSSLAKRLRMRSLRAPLVMMLHCLNILEEIHPGCRSWLNSADFVPRAPGHSHSMVPENAERVLVLKKINKV